MYPWETWNQAWMWEWERPLFLFGLLLIPLFFFIKYFWRSQARAHMELSMPHPFKPGIGVRFLRFLPDLSQTLMWLCLLLALAGPYVRKVHKGTAGQALGIALALDISSSMLAQDFSPNRLEKAKALALDFIASRPEDPIALIAFAGNPYLASPLTKDQAYLRASIQALGPEMIAEEGSSLGDALGMCLNQLRQGDYRKKICIILSDGNQTSGNLDPSTAAELARLLKTRLYTIAVGSDAPSQDPVDERTLRQLAEKSRGKFYRAKNPKALEEIFKAIDASERLQASQTRWEEKIDQTETLLWLAFGFFLLNLAWKITWIGNILED